MTAAAITAVCMLLAALAPAVLTASAGASVSHTEPGTSASRTSAGPVSTRQSRDSGPPVHHDTSPPLRSIPPKPAGHKRFLGHDHQGPLPHPPSSTTRDPVIQSTAPRSAAVTATANFEGLGQGFPGFTLNGAPPDPDAAVGATQVIQVVNSALAVFSKTGATVLGSTTINTLWSGFGGPCETTNSSSDATVRYDNLAGRWVVTQPVFPPSGPNYQCVAVSTSSDATGTYNRYAYQFSTFPDYPKISVWPDAYYVTYNMFDSAGNRFGEVCAMDRSAMLTGRVATQQCFTAVAPYYGLLASDVDGNTPPPSGEPATLVALGDQATTLVRWKFHVNFANSANSTFTGPSTLNVAPYTIACAGVGPCIPQGDTTQNLSSISDTVMYRLAYRNFGDHESLVLNHSVTAGSSIGVRWYEFRLSGGNPTVYQQGTYAPDGDYRWMGSIAIDHAGNIAAGYSDSSASTHPSIRVTGRLASDPLGTMTQAETTLMAGSGSQTPTLDRWGDYTSMSVDPVDDCTFWYTNEYLATTGNFNWHTRLASFTLPGCGTSTDNFSIAANQTSGSVAAGSSATATMSTTLTAGSAQTINLSASGLPSGATASFNPASVTSGGSSTLAISTSTSTPAGTYPITITGTGTSATHSTTYILTVTGTSTCWDSGHTASPPYQSWEAYNCHNIAPASIYSSTSGDLDGMPDPNTVVNTMRSNPSWFVCKIDDGPLNGDSLYPARWEWTLGDDNTNWGWFNDINIFEDASNLPTCTGHS